MPGVPPFGEGTNDAMISRLQLVRMGNGVVDRRAQKRIIFTIVIRVSRYVIGSRLSFTILH